MDEAERMRILDQIDRGELSPSEGLLRLQSLAETGAHEPDGLLPESAAGPTAGEPPASGEPEIRQGPPPLPPAVQKWRRMWMVPLWIGIGVTVGGSLLMYAALQSAGLGFWFACAWFPFLLGLLVTVLAWESRTAHWLHLRVQQAQGEWPSQIALSFPLPLRPTAWLVRRYGDRIPGIQGVPAEQILQALGQSASPQNPLYIEAYDEEDGDHVQIYID